MRVYVGQSRSSRWIDSSLPLWSEENLDTFLAGLSASQLQLPVVP